MEILEKSDTKDHQPFAECMGQPVQRPAIRSGRSRCSMIKPGSTRKNSTRFAEDFYWEHSVTSRLFISTEIPNNTGSVSIAASRNRHASNVQLPSCVYLG